MPVLIGNFEKGTTFTQSYDNNGNIVNLANPLHADSAWGIGGGLVYDLHFGAGTNNNWLQIYALFGRGATNFIAGTDFNTTHAEETFFSSNHPPLLPPKTLT